MFGTLDGFLEEKEEEGNEEEEERKKEILGMELAYCRTLLLLSIGLRLWPESVWVIP